jgi:hypothetical protein
VSLLGDGSLNTLLGFETAGPRPLRPFGETGGCGLVLVTGSGGLSLVVAPLWWWGVVFDLWIVVASIWQQNVCAHDWAGPFGGWCGRGCCFVVDVQFFLISFLVIFSVVSV